MEKVNEQQDMSENQKRLLQQALDMLEEQALHIEAPMLPAGEELLNRIRAAISQQAEPVEPKCRTCGDVGIIGHSTICPECADTWSSPVEQAEQQPVAMVDANDDGMWADILPDVSVKVGQMLYAAPIAQPATTGDERGHDTKGSRKALGAMNAKLRAKVGRLERELSALSAHQSAPERVSVPVERVKIALEAVQNAMEDAYNNAYQNCCGRGIGECCGNPEPAWSDADQAIMDALAPAQRELSALLASCGQEV